MTNSTQHTSKRAAYPAYKNSGIEWLGKKPAHWQTKDVKRICSFYTGWTPPTKNSDYFKGDNLWANISDLGIRKLCDTRQRISDDAIKTSRIQMTPKGSLMFSFKLSVGQVSIAGKDMYTNEAIATFPPINRVDTNYLYWVLPVFVPHNANENIYGAKLLNQELIKNTKISIAPINEQRAIAAFLDRETVRIDTLVEKKKQQIKLLQEKRIALINHAVTKGLDPNAKMKNSDIEWISKTPAHWDIKKIRFIANIQTGNTPSKSNEKNYSTEGVMWVKPDNLNEMFPIIDTKEHISSLGMSLARIIPPRASLICCIGTIGKWGFSENSVATNQQINAVIFDIRKVSSRFGIYLMASLVKEQEKWANKNVVSILSSESQSNISCPVPPIPEQRAIAAFLDRETVRIDKLREKIDKSITLLREYRSALISAAVTGKINVCAEAAA